MSQYLGLSVDPYLIDDFVMPKEGYGPTRERDVREKEDDSGRMMAGGGYEYIFDNGSGGTGTVFEPIIIPVGSMGY